MALVARMAALGACSDALGCSTSPTPTPFGVLIVTALASLAVGFVLLARRQKLGTSDDRAYVAAAAVLGAVVGGLAPGWLTGRDALSSVTLVLGTATFALVVARARRMPVSRTLDVLAVAAVPAWIVGRTACVIARDHPGRVASVGPFSATFEGVERVDLARVELAFALVVAVALLVVGRRALGLRAGATVGMLSIGWLVARAVVFVVA